MSLKKLNLQFYLCPLISKLWNEYIWNGSNHTNNCQYWRILAIVNIAEIIYLCYKILIIIDKTKMNRFSNVQNNICYTRNRFKNNESRFEKRFFKIEASIFKLNFFANQWNAYNDFTVYFDYFSKYALYKVIPKLCLFRIYFILLTKYFNL